MRKIPDGWVGANMAMHDKFKNKIKLADQVNLNVSILSFSSSDENYEIRNFPFLMLQSDLNQRINITFY